MGMGDSGLLMAEDMVGSGGVWGGLPMFMAFRSG